jgi:CubicO group peptidase (beta-lactamase class C family)
MIRTMLALLVFPAVLVAQQPPQLDPVALADSVFAPWSSTHGPGCAVGVARDGKVLLTRGYGMADLETGTPNTATTIFESGSVAKQFTATAVVLLALDGKLDLDDPVRTYVPELPDYGQPLTIRNLLTHTSGLREWSSLVALQGWPRGTRLHTQDDLLGVVTRQKALNYPVGEFYSYTNSGFGLLFTIVERVSGKSFQDFSDERIFKPLGMTHTRWRDDFSRLVPGRAQAYDREHDAWHLQMPFENVVGPGGLLSTVGDWLVWNEALTNKTLGAAVVDSLSRRMRLNDGREIQYALGLFFTAYRGLREISHSGSTAGYRTFLARYPDRGLSVAVMCNAANANAVAYGHQMVDGLIADFPRTPALDTTAVDTIALARYAGLYRSERTHDVLDVSSRLFARLRALPDGWFWSPQGGSHVHFEVGPNGAPTGLRIAQSDGDTVRFAFAAAQPWTPTHDQLQAFEGRYRSDELGVTFAVTLRNDSLTVSGLPGRFLTLRPTYPDAFETRNTAVWFTRDRRGRITAAHLGQSRMWDLELKAVGR